MVRRAQTERICKNHLSLFEDPLYNRHQFKWRERICVIFFVRISVKPWGCNETSILLQLISCFVDVIVRNVCLDFVENEIKSVRNETSKFFCK